MLQVFLSLIFAFMRVRNTRESLKANSHAINLAVCNLIENIKWLFFDMGSTLVDESAAYESRMRNVAKMANVTYEYVYETAIKFYKENKKGDLETVKLLNVKKPEWKHEDEILYSDSEDCLKKLSGKYKIGVMASAEEGIAKPDKRIFEIALNRANCEPAQSIMIGDRIDNDIVPAKKLGMRTI